MTEPTPSAPPDVAPPHATPEMRLQIMTTEHWSLLASRSLAWNETFTRVGTFLSSLSFTVVALALVGQASGFDETFRLFALVVLPVVLFLGVTASIRIDNANYHDALCVIGMNRIRAGYLELAPDLERFFVMGTSDDLEGVMRTMATLPGQTLHVGIAIASPTVVAVLDAAIAGALIAVAVVQLGAEPRIAMLLGIGASIGTAALHLAATRRRTLRQMRGLSPRFPGAGSQPAP